MEKQLCEQLLLYFSKVKFTHWMNIDPNHVICNSMLISFPLHLCNRNFILKVYSQNCITSMPGKDNYIISNNTCVMLWFISLFHQLQFYEYNWAMLLKVDSMTLTCLGPICSYSSLFMFKSHQIVIYSSSNRVLSKDENS